MRRTLTKIIRCKIRGTHDWKLVVIDEEHARVCRLCGKRDFKPPGPDRDEMLRDLGMQAGGFPSGG